MHCVSWRHRGFWGVVAREVAWHRHCAGHMWRGSDGCGSDSVANVSVAARLSIIHVLIVKVVHRGLVGGMSQRCG